MTTSATAVVGRATDEPADARLGGVFRDIARGGFAGVIVGVVGCGVGGRIAMRLAALLVPESAGSFTENGNVVGAITLGGSLGVVLFGLVSGLIAATIWVAVASWIPGTGVRRAVVAVPIAAALGATALVDGGNRDFSVLRHDGTVVAMLVGLVGLVGFLFALVDDWLDRRMPMAAGRVETLYAIVTAVGMFIALMVVLAFLAAPEPATVLTGVALVGVGAVTVRAWYVHVNGRPARGSLTVAGRTALAIAITVGVVRTIPEVSGALGVR
jgi:hypothetical protein